MQTHHSKGQWHFPFSMRTAKQSLKCHFHHPSLFHVLFFIINIYFILKHFTLIFPVFHLQWRGPVNGLRDHLTGWKKCRWQKSHISISHCKFLSILVVDGVIKNRLFKKKKKKTCCHDNNKKYFRNNIICGSFYQRCCLILPLPSKLRHAFPYVIFIKKVASLPYPSLSCKVSCQNACYLHNI